MRVSRLARIPGIGVDKVGDAGDAAKDPEILRLENLDTDLRPPAAALDATRRAIDDDAANSYLPFQGHLPLREAAAAHVGRVVGASYNPRRECVCVAGGLNGILNALLATVEPGREVVICDPIYAGLVNRIHLVGGIPRFVPATPTSQGWEIAPEALAAAVGPTTAAVLLMSPAMPTGLLLDDRHWDALAPVVATHRPWIIYDAAMEHLRFDGTPPSHPGSHPDLQGRTITVGSASKELRMIGWRVGWVVGPAEIMADVELVGMANVVCQVGIAQKAVACALTHPSHRQDVTGVTRIWAERHAAILAELAGYPVVPAHGGWSLLVDMRPLGLTPTEASGRLLEHGKVAATPMDGWGPSGEHYLRLVFANEPIGRLAGLRGRFDAALGNDAGR